MVASPFCTTQRLFLYGRLGEAERPARGGIYGLSNSQAWIYIHAVDDIRATLLDHLNERNPTPDFRSVTGFILELSDTAERSQRCSRLIEELRPVVRGRKQWL
jgi:hypothetical protein